MTLIPYWHFTVGILTDANAVNDWNHFAEVWVVAHRFVEEGDTGTYTYFDSVAGGAIYTDKQAEKLAGDYLHAMREGYAIDAAGHSNGGKLICRALQLHPEIRTRHLHLIASAAHKDCDVNGLNQAARNGQFETVTIYVSPVDEILSSPVAYGTLGLDGPQNVCPELAAKLRIVRRQCKHSDWVGVNFDETMMLMTKPTQGGADPTASNAGPVPPIPGGA